MLLAEFRRVTLVVSVDDPDEHDLPGLGRYPRLLMDNGTQVLPAWTKATAPRPWRRRWEPMSSSCDRAPTSTSPNPAPSANLSPGFDALSLIP